MEFFSNPIIIFCFILIGLLLLILLFSIICGLIISLSIHFMKLFGIKFKNIDYKE